MYIYGVYRGGSPFIPSDDRYSNLIISKREDRFEGFFKVRRTSMDSTGRPIRYVEPYLSTKGMHPQLVKALRYEEEYRCYRYIMTAFLKVAGSLDTESRIIEKTATQLLQKHCVMKLCKESIATCNVMIQQPVVNENNTKYHRMINGLMYLFKDPEFAGMFDKKFKDTLNRIKSTEYWDRCPRFYVKCESPTMFLKDEMILLTTKEGIFRKIRAIDVYTKYADKLVGIDVSLSGTYLINSKVILTPSNRLM